MRQRNGLLGAIIVLLISGLSLTAKAQTTVPSPNVAGLNDGWEDIDQRFVFLTTELSSTETSIAAVNKALVAVGYQQAKSAQAAENYRQGNQQMDRQGGGPVPWQDFYGKTAQAFFYHSSAAVAAKDNNLQVYGAAEGSKLTPIPRPPQLDYIYRANASDQQRAEAEAAKLGNKIDQLLKRRGELEAEQSALWCKIAFRALSTRELADKSLYRFEMTNQNTGDLSLEQRAVITAGCKFMRVANATIDQVQGDVDQDQGHAYVQLSQNIADARSQLKATLLGQVLLSDDLETPATLLAQFDKAAKRLADSSQNLSDAYKLAADGNAAGDDERKQKFRGQMQQSAFDIVSTIATADQLLSNLSKQWKVIPNVTRVIIKAAADEKTATVASAGPNVVNLEEAKQAFTQSVEASKEKLAVTYREAIAAAVRKGDIDAAIALRHERDAFVADGIFPKVEDGWTILFRSSDPLLFNTPVSNGESYSIPMSFAPAGTKFLRLKRMDTGDYVIIMMTADGLLLNGDPSAPFWWRGDKKISVSACNLGIVDQRSPAPGPTVQNIGTSDIFAGWGFGETFHAERQGYVWGGVSIPRTVFEIAVTCEDLKSDELNHLLIR